MKSIVMLLTTAIAIGVTGRAIACGACIEDRVAATYDHAVISGAIERHQQVLFVALEGADAIGAGRRLALAARRLHGAHAKTLRISASPAAFSIAIEGSESADQVVAQFRGALRDSGAELTLVRIMRDGALIDPK